MDDDAVQEMKIQEYLKRIDYKIPSNRDYKIDKIDKIDKTDEKSIINLWLLKKRKIKNQFYNEWQGMEDVLQTITHLFRQQDTAFKFNISLAYLLKRPLYNNEYNREGELIKQEPMGYEYKYFSAQYNNRVFEYPETIDNNRSLNKVLSFVEKKINEGYDVKKSSTEWKFKV